MTLWSQTMHLHTKFGYKRISILHAIVQTNIHWHFEPCDLDLDCSNPFFHMGTLAYGTLSSSQVCLQKDQQLKTVIFWSIETLLWPWPWPCTHANQSFCMFMMMHHLTKFGYRVFGAQEDIFQTNIHWHFEPSLSSWLPKYPFFLHDTPAYEEVP